MLNRLLLLFFILCYFGLSSLRLSSSATKWPKTIQKKSQFESKSGFELGRSLFYDPILSLDSSISCASCHLSFTAFTHVDHPTSHGIFDKIGRRNAPGLFNLAWRSNFHWDGGVVDLTAQAINPLTHPDEMGETLANVLQKLNRIALYKNQFKKVYHRNQIETWMLLDALQQFTFSLVSRNSYYDKVKRKKYQFNTQQQNGAALFECYCNRCHQAPLFFKNGFEKNGIEISSKDLGRYEVTGVMADKGLFRIPTLRNITHSFPYMHDGRFKNLKAVLAHYGEQFNLTTVQQKDIIAFLKTLTDSTFLINSEYQYHTLNQNP